MNFQINFITYRRILVEKYTTYKYRKNTFPFKYIEAKPEASLA